MAKRTVKDVDLSGKTVFARVDFNVPYQEGTTEITDDTRIEAALETIEYLEGARLVLASHHGRPEGQVVPEETLQPCANRLAEKTDRSVGFVNDCVGSDKLQAIERMRDGDILLLENTRFHPGEKSEDDGEMMDFARKLAEGTEAFVNDAFGTCHRKHASVYGVSQLLQPAVMGLLVEKEVHALGKVYNAPTDGFVAILGGAKVDDKIPAIRGLLPRCEKMLIGGAMSWAFFKAQGLEVGLSLCPPESVEAAREVLDSMGEHLSKLVLPDDVHMQNVQGDHSCTYAAKDEIKPGWDALDIGPDTRERYADIITGAKTVFWNGPMGKFEDEPFDQGTRAVAQAVADCDGYCAVGGGDSVAAITQMGLADDMDHVSTGGGASLEFMEEGTLPAIEVLEDR